MSHDPKECSQPRKKILTCFSSSLLRILPCQRNPLLDGSQQDLWARKCPAGMQTRLQRSILLLLLLCLAVLPVEAFDPSPRQDQRRLFSPPETLQCRKCVRNSKSPFLPHCCCSLFFFRANTICLRARNDLMHALFGFAGVRGQ